jgi:hypothetical protein
MENLRSFFVKNPMQTQLDTDGNPVLDSNGNVQMEVKDLSNVDNWRLYYPTAFYPYPNASGLRLGVKWRFTE